MKRNVHYPSNFIYYTIDYTFSITHNIHDLIFLNFSVAEQETGLVDSLSIMYSDVFGKTETKRWRQHRARDIFGDLTHPVDGFEMFTSAFLPRLASTRLFSNM